MDYSDLTAGRPTLWLNPAIAPAAMPADFTLSRMQDAQARMQRCAPLLASLFPDFAAAGGKVVSALISAPRLAQALGIGPEYGRLLIKGDHALPVAGSIKARGGFHEVLEFAETLAAEHGLPADGADHVSLSGPQARALFGGYEVAVGSTGNLGMSIGILASALGFRASVHMSSDAKAWKKARLRQYGVRVIEHAGDYEEAVAAGRQQAAQDPHCYFVDDERSTSLLFGYSVAAFELRDQLAAAGIETDARHPLFVYLPCGVGGAPGGIAAGLRQLFGAHVHCFFAEPVASPCFLLRMMDGKDTGRTVYDIGLTNRTEADGLAVARASELAASLMTPLLSGVFTVEDSRLFRDLCLARREAGISIEPSAAAGFSGPGRLCLTPDGGEYLQRHALTEHLSRATHVVWTTGGLLVPPAEYQHFLERGAALLTDDRSDRTGS